MSYAFWVDYVQPLILALLVGLTGLAVGLYLGERGRRLALERWLTRGLPGETAPTGVHPGPPDPEARVRELGHNKQTLANAAKSLMAQGKAAGRPLTPEQAEAMALQLLNPEFNPDVVNPEVLPL